MKNNNYKIIGVVFSIFLLVIFTINSTPIINNDLENSDDSIDNNSFNPQLSSNITWTTNGNIICNETYDQELPQICSDGAEGAIITWQDAREGIGYPDVYAQKIDSDGNTLWDVNGTVISIENFAQDMIQICSDGAGGAIIAWEDGRGGLSQSDIYAQRIDSTGNIKWTINGEAISTEVDRQEFVQICSDGAGGAILVWEDYRDGPGRHAYVQRIDLNGNVLWDVNGTFVSTGGGHPQIVSDGMGGAIITFAQVDVYAQKIDSNGNLPWGGNTHICTAVDTQTFPQICGDGAGGAIISWVDYRNMSITASDIYAQRVHQNGTLMWTVNGEAICVSPGTQSIPQICSDGTGGAIITWFDSRGATNDIYAQKVDSNGNIQWTLGGEAICTESESQSYPEICSDENGGAIVIWRDYRNGANWDVYAQWVDSDGIVETNNGIPICTKNEDQFLHQICSDGAGGAFITWEDHRRISESDIYAQHFITPEAEKKPDGETAIPFGSFFLFFIILSVLSLIIIKKSNYSAKANS